MRALGRQLPQDKAHERGSDMDVLTVPEMEQADRLAIAGGQSGFALMLRAGHAVADAAMDMAEDGPILVVAGRGNNGGDGFVAATELVARGREVSVILLCERETLKGDAALAAKGWKGPVLPCDLSMLGAPALIIDALFGAGLNRPVKGDPHAMIEAINANGAPVLSVDLPSGINGTTGAIMGTAVRATETVTFQSTSGQPFVMAQTTIGCGHNNSVTLSPAASGIIGLDRGASSLISQMSQNFFSFFSYCFSCKETSKINFGSNAVVSGDGTVSTTMFRNTEKPNFYYLNLDAISVGENRVETMGTPLYSLEGNIIIDSGTTYTYLPDSFCSKVKDAVDSVVKVERATFSGDMLCYNTADIDIFPVITMHFSGGADLVLDKYNMYDNTGDNYCLAISCVGPTEDAVFGNRAQNNWLIGYDTSSELVSFKSTDCSALY